MSQYSTKLTRLTDYANDIIIGSFADARTQLLTISAPDVQYLEILWDGARIYRAWDNTEVVTLPLSEQARLYPQLDGLFKKAVDAVNLPS